MGTIAKARANTQTAEALKAKYERLRKAGFDYKDATQLKFLADYKIDELIELQKAFQEQVKQVREQR